MNNGSAMVDKIASPGFILVMLGAVVVYASRLLAREAPQEKQEKVNIILKAVGCAVAFLGAIMLFV